MAHAAREPEQEKIAFTKLLLLLLLRLSLLPLMLAIALTRPCSRIAVRAALVGVVVTRVALCLCR